MGYQDFSDGDPPEEEAEYQDLLNNPGFAVVLEKHGWAHVKDFFDELDEWEDGAEYALVFRVNPSKGVYNTAFGNTVLGMVLAKAPETRRSLSVNVEDSPDGENHFWLLKRK